MERITLRQIEAALAVERAGAICLAAKQLHVAQPSLSQQIAALEDEVGTRLFDRAPGGTSPTPAGQVFLDGVRHLTGEVTTARLATLAAAATEVAEITVGIQFSEHVARVASALGSLRSQHPGLRARVQELHDSRALRDALRLGAVDVGFGVDLTDWDGTSVAAFDVDYVVLAPAHHPLASRAVLTREDLSGASWVESPALLRLMSSTDDWSGIVPTVTASSAQAAESLVAAGLGITVTTADRAVDESVLAKIALDPSPTDHVIAATKGELGPLERALIQAVAVGRAVPAG